MCTQEYLWRRNQNYANAKVKILHHCQKQLTDYQKQREENESQSEDENDDGSEDSDSDTDDRFCKPRNPQRSDHDKTPEERALRVQRNIQIHLDFMFPLDGSEDGKDTRWIFNVSSPLRNGRRMSDEWSVNLVPKMPSKRQTVRRPVHPRI